MTLRERGQAAVLFALMLPMMLAMGAFVIGIGNWFVHAKHLQTKADAGALAGGLSWAFPCGSQIDARIATTARSYAGATNPQVGHVPDTSIHSVLNGPLWYDNDSNPFPAENLAICNSNQLDVKVTEDNSFPLASLIPLFPDIKRKAKVEIRKVEGETGLLPIAMRAPVPLSAAVVFNESTGAILGTPKYFVKNSGILGLPSGLQGWTTNNIEDGSPWIRAGGATPPTTRMGVAIAISFRGACNTGLPNPNTLIPKQTSGPCFEDNFSNVSQLCNQGTPQIQVVNCYYAAGNYPSQTVQAGLHFIRGYSNANPGTGSPAIETAYLNNVDCPSNGYFNWQRTGSTPDCNARLLLRLNVGGLTGDYGPAGPTGDGPLKAQDIQVRFRNVRGDGSAQCNYGNNCDLNSGGQGPTLTYSTQGTSAAPDILLKSDSQENAVAIEVRLKNAVNATNANCRGNSFNANCRWFYTGAGNFGPGVAPTDPQILADPIQRSFRGNTVNASSVQWLRLTTDANCDGGGEFVDGEAASVEKDGCAQFRVEMGLKGGVALDANELPLIFNDGTATSKTGILDCDPAVPNGQAPITSVAQGCPPQYGPHSFDPVRYATTGLCPAANSIFNGYPGGNPGYPWDDWPPITCLKTRSTSAANQTETGLKLRLFGGSNSCPSDAAGYVKGRNYWKVTNNPLNAANPDPDKRYGYKDNSPSRDTNFNPGDPRLVTIFLVPTGAITTNGSVKTYPIPGFVQVYITGWGDLQNGGALRNGTTDPCPGSTPPPVAERDCQGSECGFIVWGHVLNWVIPSANGTASSEMCDPGDDIQPCIAVLVE